MQAARPSIIKYAGSITHALDQPMTTQLLMPGASHASVSSAQISMQPGRKFKREWMASHNASALYTQDHEATPFKLCQGLQAYSAV